eukprot:Hpha_TRINITY_DN16733_c1_g2::TRINITY_DN16733_c1_g2_i14::g.80351::m.80351/K16296/SCPL-I; serine carboxypeptidase-like clade I
MPCVAVLAAAAAAAVQADLVSQIPGFNKTSFNVYSGYLTVPGPFKLSPYDELRIHYQLDTSQGDPSTDPVVTWHQGGPGGSALYGLYTEMGYFRVSDQGPFANENSWNQVANMLYLESPAGSFVSPTSSLGFSTCLKGGEVQAECHWDDRSQAEAYAHTLIAFFKAFPEFSKNDLYLSGESYAGQYIPNIADYILRNASDRLSNLKGIAVGNGCWGGDEHTVQCNGPNEEKVDVDLFHGKGLLSNKLRDQVYKSCGWNAGGQKSAECNTDLDKVDKAVGPHNVYNVYDNCPGAAQWASASGKTMGWLRRFLRNNLHRPEAVEEAKALGGGYHWACGGDDAVASLFERKDVQTALHLGSPATTKFSYSASGPASQLLYPFLVQKIRVLIYNGDADACVPYIGNEEWTTDLAKTGAVTEKEAWRPWYATESVPAGYVTSYNVANSTANDFRFVTIRLAGHMVPTYRPKAAFAFFSRFLAGKKM